MPKGAEVRPALVLVRKVICDTLMPYITDAHVLDLFAGTGAFVFEMISRGAKSAIAVDLDSKMANNIELNAKTFGVSHQIEVINSDYLRALAHLAERGEGFDIIFVAPPFYGNYVNSSLDYIDKTGLLKKDGVLVAHYHKSDKVNHDRKQFMLWKCKAHGNSIMDFFKSVP